MKQLFALTTILVVVGIGGFLYRNALERPITVGEGEGACTKEAKLCPDGSAVGRTGPTCSFASCALPNAEDATIGISFVIPAGYAQKPDTVASDQTLRWVLEKPLNQDESHSIIIRHYTTAPDEDPNVLIRRHSVLEPKGEAPESMALYEIANLGRYEFRSITLERFEGIVRTAYFLVRDQDVLQFEVVERGVDWTNPDLVITALPEHKALLSLLTTLQSN